MDTNDQFAEGRRIAETTKAKLEADMLAYQERANERKIKMDSMKRSVWPLGTHYFHVMTHGINQFLKYYDVYDTLEDGEKVRVKDIRDKIVRRHLTSTTPYIKISFGDDHYIIYRYGYDIHLNVDKINVQVTGSKGQWYIHHAQAILNPDNSMYWTMEDVDTTFMENDFEYTPETIHQSEFDTPDYTNPYYRVNRIAFAEWFKQWIELKFNQMIIQEKMVNLQINL